MTLGEFAKSLGKEFHNTYYRMWMGTPTIGNTALVVDCVAKGGGYFLLPWWRLPKRLTRKYIEDAIRHNAYSLGRIIVRKTTTQFIPWWECQNDYPPGYFTHKVGNISDEEVKEVLTNALV